MTTFKPPVPAQLTPYAEINNFINSIQNYLTQLSTDLNTAFVPQMSETPQRIGTWIDGTPIYRKAFDVLLKDLDAVDYGDILRNQAFYASTVSDSGTAYPISAFCAYDWDTSLLGFCPVASASGSWIEFAVPNGVTIPEDQSDCTDERYYGYIDFIKTGDDA